VTEYWVELDDVVAPSSSGCNAVGVGNNVCAGDGDGSPGASEGLKLAPADGAEAEGIAVGAGVGLKNDGSNEGANVGASIGAGTGGEGGEGGIVGDADPLGCT